MKADDELLLAVSGGKDSMCLSYILEKIGYKYSVAHCNFGLRGNESDEDAFFVLNYFQEKKIKIHIIEFDTKDFAQKNGLNIQLAARKLRYDWFYELSNNFHYDKIITAHHANDTIETVLYNLCRGAGLSGATGIPTSIGKVIRPMLSLKAEEIDILINKNKIPFRTDSSNNSDKYTRNKIRNELIPSFQKINKTFENDFLTTIANFNNYNDLFNELIANLIPTFCTFGNIIKIEKSQLFKLKNHQLLLFEAIKKYGFNHTQARNIIQSKIGSIIKSESHEILNDRDLFLIRKIEKKISIPFYINHIGYFHFENKVGFLTNEPSNTTLQIPQNKLTFPLIIRNWQEGDKFKPAGMNGQSKKLSDLFNDLKINRFDRENVKVLISNNIIISVIGFRDSHQIIDKKADFLFIEIK